MTLPLLLGEAPSQAGDRYYAFPLSGSPAKRLCEWAGIPACDEEGRPCAPYWALIEHFSTLNAIERFADAYPWRVERARERVRAYLAEESTEVIVALGTKAMDAACGRAIGGPAWFHWIKVGSMRVAMIPHPSGRNLMYNDPENRRRAGEILREAMGGD